MSCITLKNRVNTIGVKSSKVTKGGKFWYGEREMPRIDMLNLEWNVSFKCQQTTKQRSNVSENSISVVWFLSDKSLFINMTFLWLSITSTIGSQCEQEAIEVQVPELVVASHRVRIPYNAYGACPVLYTKTGAHSLSSQLDKGNINKR